MRAVTLSDSKVARLLSDKFVCAWEDTSGDPNAGGSFAHGPKDPAPQCIRGNGEHNLQTLVLTPQGEIVNVLAGYVPPDEMLEELEFSLRTLASMRGGSREDRLVAAQRARIEAMKPHSGPLNDWEDRRAREDHEFVVDHPLLPHERFRSQDLVGNGKSFFGSSNGDVPDGRIGDADAGKMLDEMRKKMK